jgi:probable rRNA maturation factor
VPVPHTHGEVPLTAISGHPCVVGVRRTHELARPAPESCVGRTGAGRARTQSRGYDPGMGSHYLGPWRIDVEWRDDVERLIPATRLARAVAAALEAAGAPQPASIGLILSDDAELADLNGIHMGKGGPTDVLSFPLLPPDAYPPHPGKAADLAQGPGAFALPPGTRQHLGDVVVSVQRAVEQAEEGRGGHTGDVRWDARHELRLLVTHGTLHVCGWDHAEPDEEAAMRALERDLLAR